MMKKETKFNLYQCGLIFGVILLMAIPITFVSKLTYIGSVIVVGYTVIATIVIEAIIKEARSVRKEVNKGRSYHEVIEERAEPKE